MAVYSQNGYSANDRSVIATYTIPGCSRRVSIRRGDVSILLLDFAGWFNANIESIDGGTLDDWSYAERAIRGSTTTLSNHASGTALDFNALRHPLAKVNTFTLSQRQLIRSRLALYDGALRWGGDYTGRKDEMHFEINAGAASVARVADEIRTGSLKGQPVWLIGAPVVPTTQAPLVDTGLQPVRLPVLRRGSTGNWVRLAQILMDLPTSEIDGDFGSFSEAAARGHQQGAHLADDGVIGQNTWCLSLLLKHGIIRRDPKVFSPNVQLLQALLGYDFNTGKCDGYFGDETYSRVQALQSAAGIAVDGEVGAATAAVCARA